MVSNVKYDYIQKITARNSTAPSGCSLTAKYITKLADTLSDGTIFGIITELRDIQHIKLNNLLKERNQLLKTFQDKKEEQDKVHAEQYDELLRDEDYLPSQEEAILKRFKRESAELKEKEVEALRSFDKAVLEQMDQQVVDQQSYLEKAGVPGMERTRDMDTIRKQMFILSVIESLPLLSD